MTVEIAYSICIPILGISYLKVNKSVLLRPSRHLSECHKVEDILSLRDQIIESEVGSGTDIEAISERIFTRCYGDYISLVLPLCGEKLREIIKLAVEKDVVENDISHEYHCAVFTPRPPGSETEERFFVLFSIEYWYGDAID